MQWLDTGWFGIVITLVMVTFILSNIYRADKGKKELFIRRIPGLNAIDDAIGRATEMGRPVIMVPGIGSLNAVSVQALNVFAHVTKTAAQFSTPIKLCVADAAVYTVAQEVIRDVYQKQGMIERYDVDSVRFVSDRQFAFAAGVSGTILREKAAATFLLGEFFAESLIFAETANSVGAIQVAGSTQTSQTPFFIAACDYVLIGDEFYAASAYLSRVPVLVGSLVGQDWCKLLIATGILLGFATNSLERSQETSVGRVPLAVAAPEKWTAMTEETKSVFEAAEDEIPLDKPRLRKRNETSVFRLFNPLVREADLRVERPQKPPAPPAATGGAQ